MNIEERFFTHARLGRHWNERAAQECLAFFPSPYHFDPDRERAFMAAHATDYNDTLRGLLKSPTPELGRKVSSSESELAEHARAAQLEELAQEDALFPWLADGSMADPHEDWMPLPGE